MRLSSLLRQGYEGPQCRLDLIGEFSLRNGDESHGWLSSQTLQVCVFNDVIRRDEGDPGSLIDAQQSWHWLLATLAAGSGTRLTPDHAARVLTLAASGNADGNGSSLLFALISEGERRVLQLQGWTGGTGDTPGREGDYLGSSGLISNIHEALDIRGRFQPLSPIPNVQSNAPLSGSEQVNVTQLEAEIADLKDKLQQVISRLREHNLIGV